MKDESRKVSVTLNKVEIAARNHSAAVLLFCDLKQNVSFLQRKTEREA